MVLRIVELEPENATLLTEAGEIFWERGDRDQALSMWDKAIAIEDEADKKAELSMTIARVFQREKRYNDARRYARKASGVPPELGSPLHPHRRPLRFLGEHLRRH